MDYERRFRVRPDAFALAEHDPGDTAGIDKEESSGRRAEDLERLDALQERLYAEGRRALLHVSREEQRKRLLARAAEPDKQWKFSPADVAERARWDDYQDAFQAALRATSTKHAPWYVIPADHKWFMRTAVAAILVDHLEAMDPRFQTLSKADRTAMQEPVEALEAE